MRAAISSPICGKALLLFALVSLCAGLLSQAAEEVNADAMLPQTLEELKADFERLMKINSIPGGAFALVFRDSILMATFGVANLETGEPITENTHFRIGSCTKSFTGLAFLRLIEEGKVDINTPVKEIAPEIEIDNPWQETYPVRIVHLLEHTAGFEDSHPNWFYFEGPVIPLRRALEIKSKLRRVRWRPGTRFSYSSAGYTLAGYILEKLSGHPYGDYVRQAVLVPIGMTSSTIGRANENKELLSTGYERDMQPVPYWYDYDEPAGAMNSSIKEMALFIQFMLNRGVVRETKIISSELINRIGKPTTTIAARAGLEAGYSFGISARFLDGSRWYGHGGAVPGFVAEYAYNMDFGLGYVLLFNRFAPVDYYELFDLVRGYLAGGVSIPPAVPSAAVSERRLRSYCGYYESRSSRMRLIEFMDVLVGGTTITYENDTLYEKDVGCEREPLIPVSDDMLRTLSDPEASRIFTETSEGKMVYATKGSYYEKTTKWRPVLSRAFFFGTLIIMLSSVAYGAFWIPVHLYKKFRNMRNRSQYLRMRIVPLVAVLSLILGPVVVADQTILEFGRVTIRNVIFFVSTLAFAGLSVLGLYFSYRSFFKPVRLTAQIYAAVLSSACCAMALYLAYWGIIGLRFWAY